MILNDKEDSMPEYLAPGVYVEEIERGPKPIEGVATSTAAFLGETERGPIQPQLVTSYNVYLRLFGGIFSDDKFMPQSVNSFFENGGRRCYICRIVGDRARPAFHEFDDYRVTAIGPGEWGKRVFVKISESTTKILDKTTNVLKPIGIKLQIAYWSTDPGGALPDPFAGTTLPDPPTLIESFDDVVLDKLSSPNHYTKRVGDPAKPGQGNSSLIILSVKPGATVPPQLNVNTPVFSALDQDGSDGANPITKVEYVGHNDDPNLRTGLEALLLDQFREVALVYAPNASPEVVKEVITHCENQRFRFAVIDAVAGQGNATNIDPRSNNDSKYAAFYYPWITVSDPQSGARRSIPPGGAVLGIYARSDSERGVFKAPANEVIRGALDLEYNIDERTQETLNPRGVNVIRQFPGRGIRLWGARTLSSDPLWKYVPVRRLFIFLERSIYEGTQWVVFEPNDERLWARVTDTIRLFLRTQWRNGALMGTTETEAFRIACDRSTMTTDDILNGRLICEIGVAPVRPAEFVIFRIFQMTAEAQT
jgi:phage tail sheath protein FI